jgi:hypothetical protein
MKTYCKAYTLAEVRSFPGWSAGAQPAEHDLADDEIVYLCEDYIVLRNPIREEDVLFSQVTPEWQEFCTTTLSFQVPEDLTFATAEHEQS